MDNKVKTAEGKNETKRRQSAPREEMASSRRVVYWTDLFPVRACVLPCHSTGIVVLVVGNKKREWNMEIGDKETRV